MTSTTTRPDLRRARAGTAAGFLTQGLILLSLTTRLPEFTDRWDLSDAELSLVLLMMILLAGAGSVAAEALAKRRDSALLLRVGLVGVVARRRGASARRPAAALVRRRASRCTASSLGVVDAATNMQAVALEHRYAAARSCRPSTAPGPSAA